MAAINAYVTRAEFIAWIASATATSVVDDPVIDEILEEASRYCDDTTGRHFYPLVQTRLFDIPYDPHSDTLYLTDDLLSLTTLLNGDGTTIASSNLNLLNVNAYPLWGLQLADIATVTWQIDAAGSRQQVLSVTGIWGYHPDYATRAWSLAGTLGAAISDTTGLSATMTGGHTLAIGQIGKIDSEFFNITNVSTNTITWAVRGDNGSTAATHLISAPVYVWNTYKPIKSAVFQIAQSIYKRRHGESVSGIASVTAAGVVITPTDIPQLAQRILMGLSRFS
jgi:hypothetical protein